MLDAPDETTRQGLARSDATIDDGPVPPEALRSGSNARLWRWILRLTLPLLILLSSLVLYWIWFDNLYGAASWWNIIGGIALAAGVVVLVLWAFASWCFNDVS
jgi:hypothetical protein